MSKIKITDVDPKIMAQNGLWGEGCYGSDCHSICCEYGCDVDLATLKLIYKHKDLIEPLIKAKVEDCFATKLKIDDDYIGGAYRETATREKDKTCAFRLHDQKGCSLFYLWAVKKLPKKIVPTICRVYPVTWHRGRLFIDTPLRKECKCKEIVPKGTKVPSLFDTQKKEIMALFDIQDNSFTKTEKKVENMATKKVSVKAAAKPKAAAKKTTVKAAAKPKAAVKKTAAKPATTAKAATAKKTTAKAAPKKAAVKKTAAAKPAAKKAAPKKTAAKPKAAAAKKTK
ncbi:MAG: hypothetical protein HYS21_07700 [Deltaproteobacteria bacterium]|nr:hypothetical protein [Deltaproteobacteria bacterium]